MTRRNESAIFAPQADDLGKLIEMVRLVGDGTVKNWQQIADRWGETGRTAWYYVAAAENLGLIEKPKKGADLEITTLGRQAVRRQDIYRRIILDSPIIQYVANYMGHKLPLPDPPPVELDDVYEIRDALKFGLGLAREAALRRAYTLRAWLRYLLR